MLLGDFTARKKGSLSFYFGLCHKWILSYWNGGSYFSIRGKPLCLLNMSDLNLSFVRYQRTMLRGSEI